jgi:hypothetical protein
MIPQLCLPHKPISLFYRLLLMLTVLLAVFAAAISVSLANHPVPPVNVRQQNGDSSGLCTGCTATSTTVKILADSDPATCGVTYTLELELRLVGQAFTNVPNYFSDLLNKPNCEQISYPAITVSSLANGSYKWRVRERSSSGGVSDWVFFNSGATAFVVGATNTPPTISAVANSRQQGNQPTNVQIATVMDAEDAENNLTISVNGGLSATTNGVTISNLTVNAAGQVRADLAVTCTATNASFTLTVTDSQNVSANATLNVTVPTNTPPAVGTYPNSTVVTGGTLTITPHVPPTDNNTVVSVMATASPNSFTGTFSGNTSSGGVTVTNANPPGFYTITVTLTDNCGATTTRSFMLTVSACGAVLSKQRELFADNGGPDSFTVTIDAVCSWTAVSDNPDWITVTAPVGGFAGSGKVSYTVAANSSSSRRTGSITVAGQTFRILQGAQFGDVPLNHPFYSEIGKLSALGITLGCGPGAYCPDANTTREQMAIFIERALGVFNPPVPTGQTFQDVPPTLVGYPFIEDFVARGITSGCQAGPPRLYCPNSAVTREQMAIFILRGLGVFTPPPGPATPTFQDVPNSGATDTSHEFIEEFARRGITQGCAAGPPRLYCPTAPVTRGQMAVFLLRAFAL